MIHLGETATTTSTPVPAIAVGEPAPMSPISQIVSWPTILASKLGYKCADLGQCVVVDVAINVVGWGLVAYIAYQAVKGGK